MLRVCVMPQGFSYNGDARVANFAQSVNSAEDTYPYITKTHAWVRTEVGGYNEFYYSNVGAVYDFTLLHTYQIPPSGCAGTCLASEQCILFTIDGDTCKMWSWKSDPTGSKVYFAHADADSDNADMGALLDTRDP